MTSTASSGAGCGGQPATVVGRAVLVAIVLVAIPGFVSSVADILGRGP